MQYFICADALRAFVVQVLEKKELSHQDAVDVADVLLKAELWGISSHGISRLKRYIMRLDDHTIKRHPCLRVEQPYPALAAVNGDNGLGAVVMHYALRQGLERAEKYGVCAVGVRNSNHYGISGYYCEQAAVRGFITIGFSNALAAMAPWGGKRAFLGTNPLAFGFPRQTGAPIVVDMATSVVARGKILLALKQGLQIPAGWATDSEGVPTVDAEKAAVGLLLPMGGAKGYALALAVDVLSGVCTGALYGDQAGSYRENSNAAGIGHMFIFIKSDAFLGENEYAARIEAFCQALKNVEKATQVDEIYLPGERERRMEEKHRQEGIVLSEAIVKELREIGKQCRVDLPIDPL